MRFNNLERNILHLLSKQWLKSGTLGPFDAKRIFKEFSDIPDKNLNNALNSLEERGFVECASNHCNISLTQKGLSKIKIIHLPEDGKFPVPQKLE